MWSLGILVIGVICIVAIIGGIALFLRACQRRAQRMGYSSMGEYLRATPRSEEEKQDAVDLALKGIVICLLGLIFPPLLLIGALPFYYGARKVAYSSMGFGLFEDADPPSA